MEGSYEKDQKTIVGLDFFDELTNLQTAADLNKRSVSQMQCAAPPRLWKAGWSSVCARDCRGRQHTLLAFLPSASLAFLKVLVLLSWNLLVKLRVQGSFVSCSTSFESVWKWAAVPSPAVLVCVGFAEPLLSNIGFTNTRWHLWTFHSLILSFLSEKFHLEFEFSLSQCNTEVCVKPQRLNRGRNSSAQKLFLTGL